MLVSEDGLGLGRSCGGHDIWKYKGVRYNVEILKFMVRSLMYFPTVIADSWMVNILTYLSMLCMKMVYTSSSNSSQSVKLCIGIQGRDEEIASYYV